MTGQGTELVTPHLFPHAAITHVTILSYLYPIRVHTQIKAHKSLKKTILKTSIKAKALQNTVTACFQNNLSSSVSDDIIATRLTFFQLPYFFRFHLKLLFEHDTLGTSCNKNLKSITYNCYFYSFSLLFNEWVCCKLNARWTLSLPESLLQSVQHCEYQKTVWHEGCVCLIMTEHISVCLSRQNIKMPLDVVRCMQLY